MNARESPPGIIALSSRMPEILYKNILLVELPEMSDRVEKT